MKIAVKLIKNPDIDKYIYSGYGIGFNRRGKCSFGDGFGQNGIIFGADMSSSVHANNKTKSILVLGEGFTQGIDDTKLYSQAKYSINFSKTNKKFCLSLHYNGADSYLFVNGTEIIKFEAKDAEIGGNASPLCLGNISKHFSIDNILKTGLNGYVFDFTDTIKVDDILDIHKYLVEKNNKKRCLNLLKNVFFTAIAFFSFNILNVNSLECVSMNNQKCKIRSEITSVNTDEPVFYPCSITINKCKGSCNTLNDPYAKLCVPGTIKT